MGVLFPEQTNSGNLGKAQSLVPREFLLDRGAEGEQKQQLLDKSFFATFFFLFFFFFVIIFSHCLVLDHNISVVNIVFNNLESILPRHSIK